MLRLFVYSVIANDKYSSHNSENFWQQSQMHLSQKPKTFCQFSVAFLKSTADCEYLDKRDESASLSISEMIDSEAGGCLNF